MLLPAVASSLLTAFLPRAEDAPRVAPGSARQRTHEPSAQRVDRLLATLLFADIVDSTEHLSRIGDAAWRDLLSRYRTLVRREIATLGGREVDMAGDQFFATFDAPSRGVRCALAVHAVARSLGIDVRAGLHTGEIEFDGACATGIAVHVGARIAALAGAGETLVSGTVADLVAGCGLAFRDHGAHRLKGVSGEWRLYAVD